MHCQAHHRHSIFCIIPPYVLDNIVRNGNAAQRAAALRTRSVDATLRGLRLVGAAARQAPPTPQPPATPPAAPHAAKRSIYTASNRETLPGTLLRSEGQKPSGDIAADEAYDGLGATFDFFDRAYRRNSIDDAGMALDATVHFGEDYNNAFWNSKQMVFGDGDGQLFNRFTASLDVIGHELAHGVTEHEAGLQYFNQPGALNESMSDVWGSLIKQWKRGQKADEADWLIGDGLLAKGVKGVALRSMKQPGSAFDDPVLGKDAQPMHMDHFVHTFQDNGGVHINSGIPNHAFYQVAVRIGGHAWEHAGRIWYDALRDARVKPDTDFLGFARVTSDIAGKLYGMDSTQRRAVVDGWSAVGIKA